MTDAERTVRLFGAPLNCSQAVLTVFGKRYGLDSAMAAKMGRSFGGGLGHMGLTCGAVVAAVQVLGMAIDNQDEKEAKKEVYALAQEFFRLFQDVHGTADCKELLGADISTEEGLKKIQEENLFRTLCPAFVRDAAGILEKLLAS